MSSENANKRRMDHRTAHAFAGDRFEKLHPRHTWPEWLMRCTVISDAEDAEGRIVVSLSVTQKENNKAFAYFRVAVDRTTAEMSVLEDRDLTSLHGPTLQGFEGAGA